jgi:tetratricopeptide (TPR) repeat protein
VHHKALSSEVRAAAHTGLSYYEYDLLTNTFSEKSLIKETAEEVSRRKARTREAFLERLESAHSVDDRAWTQVKIGHTWLLEKEYGKARNEYRKALKIPPPANGHLRAAITMEIAKSYMKEGNYKEAVISYTHALRIGPGGWRLPLARSELEKAKKLARQAD